MKINNNNNMAKSQKGRITMTDKIKETKIYSFSEHSISFEASSQEEANKMLKKYLKNFSSKK